MKIFQLGRAYPLKHNKELETKKDKLGKTYMFMPSHFVIIDSRTVRVMGQDKHEAWCSLTFKAKTLPKWLKRCMTDAQKQVSSKAS
jgi:hypothetical protein